MMRKNWEEDFLRSWQPSMDWILSLLKTGQKLMLALLKEKK